MLEGEGDQSTVDPDGVLRFADRICVPKVADLIQLTLSEAHDYRYYLSAYNEDTG